MQVRLVMGNGSFQVINLVRSTTISFEKEEIRYSRLAGQDPVYTDPRTFSDVVEIQIVTLPGEEGLA